MLIPLIRYVWYHLSEATAFHDIFKGLFSDVFFLSFYGKSPILLQCGKWLFSRFCFHIIYVHVMRSLCYIRTMSLLLIIFQLDLFQRRGSLVLLYVFGPYIIEKALSKLELWLQRSESWPNGKKVLHCSNSAIDVINFELLSIIVLIYHQPVIEPCSSLPSRPLPSPPFTSLSMPSPIEEESVFT